MAFPTDLIYVRTVFDLTSGGNPTDTASFGYHMRRTSGSGDLPLAEIATLAVNEWLNSDLGTASWYSASVKANHVDAYAIGSTGHAFDKASVGFVGDEAWVGTATDGLPWQDAVALSLYCYEPGNFVAAPKSLRGRIYLPPISADLLDQDGTLDGSAVTDFRTAGKAYFDGMNALGVVGQDIVVGVLSTHLQSFTAASWVRLGQTVDTQRRRRNKLPENYSAVELA